MSEEGVRLLVLWSRPEDVDAFEHDYRANHMPLAAHLPGLLEVTSCRLRSPEQHRLAELRFADADTMRAAMSSEEGLRLAADAERLSVTHHVTATNMVALAADH